MESQWIHSDNSSHHRSQDGDYVHDGQDDYSDSCDNSFIYDSELEDDAHYFNDRKKPLYKIFIQIIQDMLMTAIY